jgi:hypothetical protein
MVFNDTFNNFFSYFMVVSFIGGKYLNCLIDACDTILIFFKEII